MRKIQFINGEYYHIFNRGVEKRDIFTDNKDLKRFLLSMFEFNGVKTIGSIHQNSFRKSLGDLVSNSEKLVEFVCYCLCPNHYHFVVKQISDRGIEKFMHRLGLGYAGYFNTRHKRSGSLFQGTFKANHIDTDEYLLTVSAYVNLNYKIHHLENNLFVSSWDEYLDKKEEKLCNPEIIFTCFNDKSEYQIFAENSAGISMDNKDLQKSFEYI